MATQLKVVGASGDSVNTDRQKALDAALAQIERAFGKGSAMKLGSREKIEIDTVSTGSLGLDIALGVGGLPRGRVIEIYGPESSGKTTLALHVIAEATAWIRSQVSWPLDRAGANKPAKTGLLTPRETQILQWIYHGKSNIEIGMILDISPLTVKNHVQKTLRKLNVLNRTQAVGKALALRLVNP